MSSLTESPVRDIEAPGASAPTWRPTRSPAHRSSRDLRFAVLHLGARMHYAVPALLQAGDMLKAFYTDAVGNVGALNVARKLIPQSLRSKPVRRLLGRQLPEDIESDIVVSTPGRALAHAALSRIPAGRALLPLTSPTTWLQKTMVAENFRGANALYCMNNSDLEVVRAAKRRGMFVVYEQICCPEIGRTLREERSRFPGLEHQDSEDLVESGIRQDLKVWSLSDVILAPSAFVRDSMIRLGCAPERIVIVPYGLSEEWANTPARTVPGRVLFVGQVGLLKGNHYLAEAQRILRERGLSPEFRVVGPCPTYVKGSPLFSGPDYVGQVPRDAVREEFAQADVFAFPTLSESFGLAHLEALACGIPVVTTPNCGSVVRHGTDGFIVPIRDPMALADRIEQILRQPSLRAHMSENARLRARQYSWAQYSRSLLSAILRAEPSPVRAAVG